MQARAPQTRIPRPKRRARTRAVWAVLVVLVLAVDLLGPHVEPHTRPAADLDIRVTDRANGTLPAAYAGFSFEKSLLQKGAFAPGTDLFQALRSLGPQVLRFGGNTSERGPDAGALPGSAGGAYVPDATVLHSLREFLEQSDSTAIYTIALKGNNIANAAHEAATVEQQLGPTLSALAIGNEPDLYGGNAPKQPWNAQTYASYVSNFYSALRTAAPGVPLVGPDAANFTWFTQAATAVKQLDGVTQHYYALGCQSAGSKADQRDRLLQNAAAGGDAAKVQRLVTQARGLGQTLRLDEANSTSCAGNTDNLANTGSSALWAVAFLLGSAQIGVTGVNFHSSLTSCKTFSPVCVDAKNGSLNAQPLLDAMRFVGLVGHGTFLQTTTSPGSSLTPAWTVRHADGSQSTVVLNMSPDPVRVEVGQAGGTPSGVARLTTTTLASRTTLLNGTDLRGAAQTVTTQPLTTTTPTTVVAAYSALLVTTLG